jgi:hypothetical protein
MYYTYNDVPDHNTPDENNQAASTIAPEQYAYVEAEARLLLGTKLFFDVNA